MGIVISEMQRSALQEAGNIGSGHAAIALSQLMGKKIMIAIPEVDVRTFDNTQKRFDAQEGKFVDISMKVLGDASGAIVFVIHENMAKKLYDIVTGYTVGTTKEFAEAEVSALKEVGSVMSIAYLNALNEMTGLTSMVTIPEFSFGSMNILASVVKKFKLKNIDRVICIRTEFLEAADKIDAFLYYLPQMSSIERLLNRLGV